MKPEMWCWYPIEYCQHLSCLKIKIKMKSSKHVAFQWTFYLLILPPLPLMIHVSRIRQLRENFWPQFTQFITVSYPANIVNNHCEARRDQCQRPPSWGTLWLNHPQVGHLLGPAAHKLKGKVRMKRDNTSFQYLFCLFQALNTLFSPAVNLSSISRAVFLDTICPWVLPSLKMSPSRCLMAP